MTRIIGPSSQRLLGLLLASTLVLAGCTPNTTLESAPAADTPPAPPTTVASEPVAASAATDQGSAYQEPTREVAKEVSLEILQEAQEQPSQHEALVARVLGETDVYAEPGSTTPVMTLSGTTILGTVTVLGVVETTEDGWIQVILPIRPNGTTGWVKGDAVELFVVNGRIVVDLTARTLTYYVAGDEVLSTPVAIGSSRNPTPEGLFYVTDSVTLADPNSPWGPHALGISARSETITEYNGGDGIIGLHGTNKPSSIGDAASLGCVRLPNEAITLLHSMVPIGTPVEITS